MKKLHIPLLILFVVSTLAAQQQPIFSQFFQQYRAMNPAAAGSAQQPMLAAFHRQQWAGLEGSPSTQALAFDTPAFGERVGLGLNLMSDRIGFFNSVYVTAQYAYRMKVGSGTIGVGMSGSYQRHQVDWTAARTLSGNPDITDGTASTTPAFNVGIGLHFEGKKGFFGLSVPGLLEKGITPETDGVVNDFSGTVPHLLLTAGWEVRLSDRLKFRPAFSSRLVKNAPSSTDVHLGFGCLEEARLWLGGTYRWSYSKVTSRGDAVSLSVQYGLNERLRAGLAYDFALHSLQTAYSHTYELMLDYKLRKEEKAVRHPRFF